MSTYFTRPRERLPSLPNSLRISSPPPSSSAPYESILIFPTPASDSAGPSSPTGELYASSRSSIVSSLPSPLTDPSYSPINESPAASPGGISSDGTWEDVGRGVMYGPPMPLSLTRRRVETLGVSALGFSGWGLETDESDRDAQGWEWTSSLPSPTQQLAEEASEQWGGTQYEDASSQFHFCDTRSESQFPSVLLLPEPPSPISTPRHASLSRSTTHAFHFPFEALIRFFFAIDDSTLTLLKRTQRYLPTSRYIQLPGVPYADAEPTLFPISLTTSSDENTIESAEQSKHNPYLLLSLSSRFVDDTRYTIRKGFEAVSLVPVNPFLEGVAVTVKAPLYAVRAIPRLFGVKG